MLLTEGLEHTLRTDEPLAGMTSINLGGNAEYFAQPTTEAELLELIKRFAEAGKQIRLIGSGTNVLIPDEGVKGLVIRLDAPEFCQVTVEGNCVTAGGGAKIVHLIATSAREGLAGLHNLTGIPGTVGAALHGNSGTHGFDIGSLVSTATVITRAGEIITRNADSMAFSHRKSSLNELVIVRATFELEPDSEERLTHSMQQKWIVARSNQTFSDENSLYVFKDYHGEPASDVIDRAGFKGTSLGPVSLSDRNSNFLVAGSTATSEDVKKLITHVENQVALKLNIELETAVQIW